MKTFILFIASILGILSLNSSIHAQEKETVDLKVVITNINIQKGSVEMGLFKNSKSFLTKGQEFRSHFQKVDGNTMTIYFKDLPKGSYAVSFFQDVNSDGKCNINILARPSEPYGFSNNVKLKLFKPSFESCEFNLLQNRTISIKSID